MSENLLYPIDRAIAKLEAKRRRLADEMSDERERRILTHPDVQEGFRLAVEEIARLRSAREDNV